MTIGAGVAVVAAGSGYTAYAYETQTDFGTTEPAAGAIVASAAPTITVKADTSALSDVRVMIDGADLSERVTAAGGGLAIETLKLTILRRAPGEGDLWTFERGDGRRVRLAFGRNRP